MDPTLLEQPAPSVAVLDDSDRIGEAKNPGPLRPQRGRQGSLFDVELVEQRAIVLRTRIWDAFVGWLRERLSDSGCPFAFQLCFAPGFGASRLRGRALQGRCFFRVVQAAVGPQPEASAFTSASLEARLGDGQPLGRFAAGLPSHSLAGDYLKNADLPGLSFGMEAMGSCYYLHFLRHHQAGRAAKDEAKARPSPAKAPLDVLPSRKKNRKAGERLRRRSMQS